jgi:hypothetical protein
MVGTETKPFAFTWTPDSSTPDLIYYQCAVHQKIGWEIRVVDADAPSASAPIPIASTPPLPSQEATAPSVNTPGEKSNECTIVVDDEEATFGACFRVDGVGSNFHVAWDFSPHPDEPSSSILFMALNASVPEKGYVAVGFPKAAGEMVGATAIVLSHCPSCGSLAAIEEYYLDGRTSEKVYIGGDLNATGFKAFSDVNGTVSGWFKVTLQGVGIAKSLKRRSLFAISAEATATSFPMLYAAGILKEQGVLSRHTSYGSSNVDLTAAVSGSDAAPPSVSSNTTNNAARTAHMWLMTIGWGFFIPLGILMARYKPKALGATGWFQLHLAIQTLGFCVGIAGLACAFVATGGWETPYTTHRSLGITIMVLGAVQMFSLVTRPSKQSKYRAPWSLVHRWLGRAVAVIAVGNIFYGIVHVASLGIWAWATYTAALGALAVMAAIQEATSICYGAGQGKNDHNNGVNDPAMAKVQLPA